MKLSDTQPIKDSLQRLMTAMTNLGLEAPSRLQPGLTRQEILNAFAEISLTPSEDVIGFYEFCNGVVSSESQSYKTGIVFGYYILPLLDAVEKYRYLADVWEGIELTGFNSFCFPVLEWEGDYYMIDFAAEKSGQPCVISYDSELGIETVYSSLRSMIDTLAQEYEQGEFSFEDDKVEYHGGPKSYEIAKQNNSDVPKWNGGSSPFANFIPPRESQEDDGEAIDISYLTRRFTKNALGPQATLYMIAYANPGSGASVFEVVIIMPATNQLPPMAYISKPPKSMTVSDEQIIREAASDVREQYGFVADVGSDESHAWRNRMQEYMQMLAGI